MKEVEFKLVEGAHIRLLMLTTHYRKPLNFTQKRLEESAMILESWVKACEPCWDDPPPEILECLMDDLNTSQTITIMHSFRKKKEGKKLFASMRFLGFLIGTEVENDHA